MSLPLEGLKIADFSWVVAGPFTTLCLAAMGAEVIKVESGTHTDMNRRLPPFADGEGITSVERSGLFQSLNFSKRSVTINLATEAGQDLALDLIRQCDVVVENYAYGQMDRFNLGWERLHAAKPDLIMLSSSGLGRTGPHRHYVTFGPPLVALTGLASTTGQLGGPPERLVGGIWPDQLSGLIAAFHLLAAIEYRDRTGVGQLLEYSMAEMAMSHMPEAYIDFTRNGRVWEPQGNRDPSFSPQGFFPCRGDDSWIAIAVDSEDAWRGLCAVMGRDDWLLEDSPSKRKLREAEFEQELALWTHDQDADELATRLQNAGVPADRALNADGLLADPQLRSLDFFCEFDHPEVGCREHGTFGWKFMDTDLRLEAAPLLGAHNLDVFVDWLGMDELKFAELVASEVIA